MAGRTVTGLMNETKSTYENLRATADAAISGMERKKELEGQIQSLMAAVKSEESAIASLQAQYDKLEGELDKIPDDGDDDELNSNYEMVRQQVRERMQEVERELQEAERRKQAYERELENKKVERENVMRELMDQRGEIQGMERILNDLRQKFHIERDKTFEARRNFERIHAQSKFPGLSISAIENCDADIRECNSGEIACERMIDYSDKCTTAITRSLEGKA